MGVVGVLAEGGGGIEGAALTKMIKKLSQPINLLTIPLAYLDCPLKHVSAKYQPNRTFHHQVMTYGMLF